MNKVNKAHCCYFHFDNWSLRTLAYHFMPPFAFRETHVYFMKLLGFNWSWPLEAGPVLKVDRLGSHLTAPTFQYETERERLREGVEEEEKVWSPPEHYRPQSRGDSWLSIYEESLQSLCALIAFKKRRKERELKRCIFERFPHILLLYLTPFTLLNFHLSKI